jgi:hypothetical protein
MADGTEAWSGRTFMALTAEQKRVRNAGYQTRWRERRAAELKARPEVVEGELIRAAERRGDFSDQERQALADKLADAAMGHLRRAQDLAVLAQRVCLGAR